MEILQILQQATLRFMITAMFHPAVFIQLKKTQQIQLRAIIFFIRMERNMAYGLNRAAFFIGMPASPITII